MKKVTIKLDLSDVLNWKYLDIEALESYISNYVNISELSEGEAVANIESELEGFCGEKTDINSWIYAAINLTFYEVTNAIKESEEYAESDDLQEKVTELEDNFAPFINYCDSWFSNCFDELDFDSDNIVEQVISLLYK